MKRIQWISLIIFCVFIITVIILIPILNSHFKTLDTIDGWIIDFRDGHRIENADVGLYISDGWEIKKVASAITNSNGYFEFHDIRKLSEQLEDFESYYIQATGEFHFGSLHWIEKLRGQDYTLVPGGKIGGHILNHNPNRNSFITVKDPNDERIYCKSVHNNTPYVVDANWFYSNTFSINSDGSFESPLLMEGSYTINYMIENSGATGFQPIEVTNGNISTFDIHFPADEAPYVLELEANHDVVAILKFDESIIQSGIIRDEQLVFGLPDVGNYSIFVHDIIEPYMYHFDSEIEIITNYTKYEIEIYEEYIEDPGD
ncbi:MAG: hypothetical protein U9R75_03150 [Candidatus Thermoplasmatota archaeon]|nr:hypothetical protein [Candidatus Thermoplasmatota archaeon]